MQILKVYFPEFENDFTGFKTYFFATAKDIVLFKIYFRSTVFSKQNAVVLIFESASDIKRSV